MLSCFGRFQCSSATNCILLYENKPTYCTALSAHCMRMSVTMFVHQYGVYVVTLMHVPVIWDCFQELTISVDTVDIMVRGNDIVCEPLKLPSIC